MEQNTNLYEIFRQYSFLLMMLLSGNLFHADLLGLNLNQLPALLRALQPMVLLLDSHTGKVCSAGGLLPWCSPGLKHSTGRILPRAAPPQRQVLKQVAPVRGLVWPSYLKELPHYHSKPLSIYPFPGLFFKVKLSISEIVLFTYSYLTSSNRIIHHWGQKPCIFWSLMLQDMFAGCFET